MRIATAKEFMETLSPQGRLLGLDVGSATIGLALSDARRVIASPLETVTRTKWAKDLARLQAVIAAESVVGLVIGYPLNMDGSEGPRCQSTRAFAANLEKSIAQPITFWDERMSTLAVERMMEQEADLSRVRRAELVDKLAASYMLQGFLDGVKAYG